MKKIIFIDSNLNTGGAERILCTLIRNIDKSKYNAEVVITGKPGEMCALLPDDINVTYLNISRSRYAPFKLAKLFNKSKPDAVFSVSYNSAFAALFARYISGLKFRIVVRHCLMPRQMINEGFIKLNSLKFRLEKFLMKKLDCIIPEHKYMQEELAEIYNIEDSKMHFVLNPLDTDLIDSQIKENFSFPKNQINIVAAGRINKEKGFDFLIDSFSLVVEKDKRFHLYIIGKDINNNKKKLEDKAKLLGCINNIHFEGFQSNPYKYFKAADLFVLSSRWEASPNVVFENLYLGKNVVATNCSPILQDIISSNGILVNFNDTDKLCSAILKYKEYIGKSLCLSNINDFYNTIIGEDGYEK